MLIRSEQIEAAGDRWIADYNGCQLISTDLHLFQSHSAAVGLQAPSIMPWFHWQLLWAALDSLGSHWALLKGDAGDALS